MTAERRSAEPREPARHDVRMTPPSKHPRTVRAAPLPVRLAARAALLACAGVALAACGSTTSRQVPATRYQVERAERPVPSELADMRASLAEQRQSTQGGLDRMMGGTEVIEAQPARPWYGPAFDVLESVASLGGLLF